MNHNEDILKKLKEESEMIKIPDSLQPDNMMKMIKSQEAQRIKTLQKKRKFIRKITTVAASLVIICLVGFGTHLWMDRGDQLPERVADIESLVVTEEAQITVHSSARLSERIWISRPQAHVPSFTTERLP